MSFHEEAVEHRPPRRIGLGRWSVQARDLTFALASIGAIMEQPHIPLGLPGYRALMWLGLMVAARLLSGRGWASFVGIAAAVGTLMIGRSPDGVWGIMQYVIGGMLVDAVLAMRPKLAQYLGAVVVLGSVTLALVGWIAPVGQGFSGGAGVGDLWYALETMGLPAWTRLIGFDLAFGAGAGLIGIAVAWALCSAGLYEGIRPGVRAGLATPVAI